MKAKGKIVIVESSELIRSGLISLINQKIANVSVFWYPSLSDFFKSGKEGNDLLIISPLALREDEQKVVKQQLSPQIAKRVIALFSGNYPNNLLRYYDDVINIYEHSDQIINKIFKLIEKNDLESSQEQGDLSEREKEVLEAVALGKPNKEIADILNISIHTVMTHRKNITKKLGITSISGLTVYAIINKIIDVSKLKG